MKIISAILFALLFVGLHACSDQNNTSVPNNNDKQSITPTIQSTSKVLEPHGSIKNTVLNELQEGRWELVMFWATYCPICKKDFEKLAKFMEDNPSINLTIVGVVTDGIESRHKAISQIDSGKLNYTHVLTDFDRSNEAYQDITQSRLIGVPSQLLYNTSNELVAFSRNAIDMDALEIVVYE